MFECVFLCVCYQPSVRAVCQNHEVVVFQPWTATAPDLGSVANITTFIYLTYLLFQTCSGSFSLPPPRPISYFSPIFHPSKPLLSLFSPAFPPHLPRVRSDHPPGCYPRPPASTACLHFPPSSGGPRSSLRDPVTALPRPIASPFPSLNFYQVSVSPSGSPVRGSLPPSA